MKKRFALGPVLAGSLAAGTASGACVVDQFAALPVTMQGTQPLVQGRINGAAALFLADSGAFYSMISPGAAAQFHLALGPAPFGMMAKGVGGTADLKLATVRDFTLSGAAVPRAEFLVGGSEVGGDAVGLIGQNILGIADVEYDLANGVIRLMRPKGCDDHPLAYWAKPPVTYGMMTISAGTPLSPFTNGYASVNGLKIRVAFDTGASASVLSMAAARRLGITPTSPGVVSAGYSGGVGRRTVASWIAPVDVFEIGGETIEHTHLRFGDVQFADSDMLVGADFFLSHRVYVANGQHRLYFTYNGGPVFNLARWPGSASQPMAATAPTGAEPTDAAGFAGRGAASAARGELVSAIADLTRAMQLNPANADYPFQRGMAHLRAGQPVLAMSDFDRVLMLTPGAPRALLARATLELRARDKTGAVADLDAADKALASQADQRLVLGQLYRAADSPERALEQYDMWIAAHPVDRRQAEAQGGRCWLRAQLGVDLDKGLADCAAAIRAMPGDFGSLDGRGFIHLRQGDLDKAIADFDQALGLSTKNAWPYFGRGLARLKKGLAAAGAADVAAAKALNPHIAEEAAKYGLTP